MRKYTLASPTAKATVDLRNYQDVIIAAVHEYLPTATVRVEADCYYVAPAPSKGNAIRIGRQICQSPLKEHCVQIPKLFTSVETGGQKKHGTKKQPMGGHQ